MKVASYLLVAVYLFLSASCLHAQSITKIKIGLYIEDQINFHTQLITDIADYYAQEKIFRDRLKLENNDLKKGTLKKDDAYKVFDSVDVIERAFGYATIFASLELNPVCDNPAVVCTDTSFFFFTKMTDGKEFNLQNAFKKDTIDYIVFISNIKSKKNPPYFDIYYDVLIQPKKKKPIKMTLVAKFINKYEHSPLLACDEPLQCLLSDLTKLSLEIKKKIIMDGYRQYLSND